MITPMIPTYVPVVMPRAWMGYAAPARNGRTCVKVCAWCPDKDVADELAASLDLAVTHGICTVCFNDTNEGRGT